MEKQSAFLVLQEVGGNQVPGPSEEQRCVGAEDTNLLPMVFFCAGCHRPVGDTLSWVANDEKTGCILLRRASDFVLVDEKLHLSKFPGERGCTTQTLLCSGCSMALGNFYRSTPKDLDYKKDLFCFRIDSIESYILGSAEKEAGTDGQPVIPENQAVLEKELERVQTVLSALETMMTDAEVGMASLSSKF